MGAISSTAIAGKRFSELGLERESREAIEVEEQTRMVRCSLAPTAARRMDLTWFQGRGHAREPLFLEPGKSRVIPLDRAQVHFGPFALIEEMANCTDEKRKNALQYTIATEKDRLLKRYDHERPLSKGKDGYEPTGPHRFPDVTVTVLNSDGSESEPIRLHQLYEIGEFDPLKDQFNRIETIASVRSESDAKAAAAQAEVEALRRTAAEALGMVKGVVAAAGKSA